MVLKKHSFLFITILALFILTGLSFAEEAIQTEKATLVSVEGLVMVKNGPSGKILNGKAGMVIEPGSEVKTGPDAYAFILLYDGSTVKLGNNTKVQIVGMTTNKDEKKSKMKLFFGRVWNQVTKSTNRKTNFEVEAPYTLASVRGTTFEVRSNGSSDEVYVYEGDIKAKCGQTTEEVKQDSCAQTGKSGIAKPSEFDKKKLDDWQKWNMTIDKKVDNMRKDWKGEPDRVKLEDKQLRDLQNVVKSEPNPFKGMGPKPNQSNINKPVSKPASDNPSGSNIDDVQKRAKQYFRDHQN